MRLHGISFLTAVLTMFILTSRPAAANAIIETVSAATDETTPEALKVLLPDIAAEPNAALFAIPDNVTPLNIEPFDPSDDGFLSPELLSLEPGSFPAPLQGTQEILNAVPEPVSPPWITCGLLTIAWIGRRKRT
jgi:hypothetical protein